MVYENRIYSRAEMRRLDIFTDEYALMRDEGDATGTLVLKAEARRTAWCGCSLLFQTVEKSSRLSFGGNGPKASST